MTNSTDLTNWTTEELQAEWKKRRGKRLFASGLIGFFIGVLLFGLLQKGWKLLIIVLPLWLIYQTIKGNKEHKEMMQAIEAELKRRGQG